MKGLTLPCFVFLVYVGAVLSGSTTESEIHVETSSDAPKTTYQQKISSASGPDDTSTTTTTPSTTTVTVPPSTLEPADEIGFWYVNDTDICILFAQALDLDFFYENEAGEQDNTTIHLPITADASGKCSNNNETNTITLTFSGHFELTYIYQRQYPNLATSNYFVKDITLNYDMTSDNFDGIKENVTGLTAQLANQTLYEAQLDQTFLCNASQTLDFPNHGSNYLSSITHTHLKSEAFRSKSLADGYASSEVRCDDDLEVNNIVPIAVGAALAALVVIVLIAYLIGRRTRKRGYESV